MPLQIRRGTEAERLAMTQKLADGELLWITDDKKLYVGDGVTSTPVLAPVTGFNAEDAQDAAATMITSATHNGVNFTYDDTAGTLTASVDLTNYSGSIKADAFKGTVVADDSTILVDAVAGVLKGQLIGSLTGNVTGDVTGNVSGNVTGDVTGNVNGDVTGNVTGDLSGNVIADDASTLVDSATKTFTGTLNTGNTTIDSTSLVSSTPFYMGSSASALDLNLILGNNLQIRQIADPSLGKFITINLSRGTVTSPAAVQAGDELGGIIIRGYSDTTTSAVAGAFGFIVDPTAVIAGGDFIKSKAVISASSDTTNDIANAFILDSTGLATVPAISVGDGTVGAPSIRFGTDGGTDTGFSHPLDGVIVVSTNAVEKVRVDSGGMRVVGFMKVGGFATGSLPSPAEAGMIVLDTSTNQFKGYNGSAWVVLG